MFLVKIASKGTSLTDFELTNQLPCMNFPSPERKIFQKDLKSTLPSSVALWFRNLNNLSITNTQAGDCVFIFSPSLPPFSSKMVSP